MIGWFLKKVPPAQPASQRIGEKRPPSLQACAIWHDVVRALDAKPKSSK